MNHVLTTEGQLNSHTLSVNALVNLWFEGVNARDAKKLLSLLHPDMQLTVPFQTEVILGNVNVLQTFKIFDEVVTNFDYKSDLIDGKVAALRFDGDINGEHLQGVEFFHFDSEGQVEKIEIMARPLKAIQYLHEAVNELKTKHKRAKDKC